MNSRSAGQVIFDSLATKLFRTGTVFRFTRRSDGPDSLPTEGGFGDPLGPDSPD
jgi:hypothetical protein